MIRRRLTLFINDELRVILMLDDERMHITHPNKRCGDWNWCDSLEHSESQIEWWYELAELHPGYEIADTAVYE